MPATKVHRSGQDMRVARESIAVPHSWCHPGHERRSYHALSTRSVSAGAVLAAGAGGLPPSCGAERSGPPDGGPAVRPKPAPVRFDAGAAEPGAGPRAPTLQTGGAFLGAAVAHARLADAAAGARDLGAGGARWAGAHGGPDTCGLGQRAL